MRLKTQTKIDLAYLFTFTVILWFVMTLTGCSETDLPIAVGTLNLHNDPTWSQRKDLVVSALADADADVVALQEVSYGMAADLIVSLPQYDFIGADRGDGTQLTGLLTKRGRFCELNESTFTYTSHTPGLFDAWNQLPRPVVCDRINNRTDGGHRGAPMTVCSVHMSGENYEGVMAELRTELGDEPGLILAGDFNTMPGPNPWAPPGAPAFEGWLDDTFADAGVIVPFDCNNDTTACADPALAMMDARIDLVLTSPTYQVLEAHVAAKSSSGLSDHPLMITTVLTGPSTDASVTP